MRTLLLPDRDFLLHERSMLARLEVGLADEGHRVLHGVPASLADHGLSGEAPVVYSTFIPYADRGLLLTRALRAQALVESIRQLAPPDPGAAIADAVHAFGRGAWDAAQRVARRTGAKLIVEVFQASDLGPAAELAVSTRGATLIAADEPLGADLSRRVGPERVHVAPWGVHLAEYAHDDELVARGAGTLTVVVLSSGEDGDGLRTAISGVASLASRAEFAQRGIMVFADAEVARRQPVWKWAEEAGLSGRLSVIADLEGRREMVLQADVLFVADAAGRQRSFVLDAMAAGMLIVARPDPLNSVLIDGRTCRLIKSDTASAWAEAAATVLGADHAQDARTLGESARAFVRAERLASRHIARVLTAYGKILQPAGAAA